MNIHRSAAVLAAVAVIGTAAPAMAAPSASPSPSAALPSGLYGNADPKFDGVWRQSLTLLAQHAVGLTPADKAVDWLTGQQCADGSFAAFRADATKPCAAGTATADMTAVAVQALKAIGGHDAEAGKAVTWLKAQQSADGGWGYPGSGSDANTTGGVIAALTAVGENPAGVSKGGKNPYDALAALAVPCGKDGGGALGLPPMKGAKLSANAYATAAGVLGALNKGLATTAGKARSGDAKCSGTDLKPEDIARNGTAYLTAELHRTGGHLESALAGAEPQPDHGSTAYTVVALAAQGYTEQARKPYAWLEKNSVKWAQQSGPAAYAELILAAHVVGGNPRDFGGTDLVKALNATGPAPQEMKKPTGADTEKADKSDSGYGVWWIVGVGLVAGIGAGFLLSGRKKRQQP
ncbi:prenyltransferase/squalene oxidase repeat-containing protein [Streptomyces sp. NPDC086787]|uniref:prenyltransferase/squalene oxidase repeat-containing protein n=1 Tax=Streptomyces sp. NPDC086787 TaxID=3365759 RepID=UPI0038131781